MKTLQRGIIGVGALLLASAVQTFAIEGLKLSVHCPDVWLSWPSVEGDYYIVQWREDLSTNSTWVTLTNLLPAETGTNITTFVHSNRVDCPTGQIFGMMMTSGGGGDSFSGSEGDQKDSTPTGPVVVPKDGSKAPMPLGIYPPGLGLSGYIIIWPDGSTDEWSKELVEKWRASRAEEQGDPQPEDAGGDGPGTGFYQVVRDGVYVVSVTNLTNGVLSGTLDILFEAGNADPNGIDVKGALRSATLLIDGEKFAGDGVLGAPPAYPWQFTIDTAFLENGDHWLQVQVSWKNPDTSDNNHHNLSRWSNPIYMSVSNQVNYPQWEPEVGEADIAAFYLQTVHTNAAWQIVITDVSTNHVQTLSGYATNGIIEAYWDLMDTNNVARTNASSDPSFDSVTTVQAAAGPTSKKNPKKIQRPKDWPDHGKWVIAYQDYFKFEYSANNAQKGSLDKFVDTANKYGGYYIRTLEINPTNDPGQTYPLRYQETNHFDTNITIEAIGRDYGRLVYYLSLTNSRNFYYDGHTTANDLGDGAITADFIASFVKHRYRFVFINGCSSANGGLDKVFGINGPKRFDIDHYRKSGLRPAAFMGYTVDTQYAVGGPVTLGGVTYDDTIPFQVPGFITNFIFYWDPDTIGYGLLSSIDNAKSGLPSVNGQYREDFLVIHGYFNLHIDEVNHRLDAW